MSLFVQLLREDAKLPTCAHPGEDLAYDLYALEDTDIEPHWAGVTKIRTGVAATFRHGIVKHGLLIRDRSSLASKGVVTVGGVIDAGYTGEIIVLALYFGTESEYRIRAGDKIAQMIPLIVDTYGAIKSVENFDFLPTNRKEAGFGSTGV